MRNRHKFIIFCIVGGMATAIDIFFFNVFFFFFNVFIVSRILGIGVSMIFNFLINRNITFSAREVHWKGQLLRFLLVHGVAMTANVSTGLLIISILGPGTLNANIAALAGLIVSVPASFLGSLFWTFKK